MAPQVVTDFVAMVSAHPILFGLSLILFTPPFFPILRFFSPLLISTALFMLALFTMGPKSASPEEAEDDTDRSDGAAKRRRPDGGWMDWVKSVEETSLAFMSPRAKLKKERGSENVSVLEDASWAKGGDFSSYSRGESGVTEEESRAMVENAGNSFMPTLIAPSMLFKVDSGLKAAAERSIYDDLGEDGPDEDAPELEDVEESEQTPLSHVTSGHGLQHQPLHELQIPDRAAVENAGSPDTDLDSSSDLDKSTRFLLRRNSSNAHSGHSDADTPIAAKLSLSGKLHQMETLGDFIDDTEHAENTGQESPELHVLQPTTAEQVEAVKDQLESFVQKEDDAPHVQKKKEEDAAPPSPSSSAKNPVEEPQNKGEVSQ